MICGQPSLLEEIIFRSSMMFLPNKILTTPIHQTRRDGSSIHMIATLIGNALPPQSPYTFIQSSSPPPSSPVIVIIVMQRDAVEFLKRIRQLPSWRRHAAVQWYPLQRTSRYAQHAILAEPPG